MYIYICTYVYFLIYNMTDTEVKRCYNGKPSAVRGDEAQPCRVGLEHVMCCAAGECLRAHLLGGLSRASQFHGVLMGFTRWIMVDYPCLRGIIWVRNDNNDDSNNDNNASDNNSNSSNNDNDNDNGD